MILLEFKSPETLHVLHTFSSQSLSIHLATAVHTRPTKVPQPLGKQQMEMIVGEGREQVTIAVEGMVADLEDRFPRRDVLYAFEIISPEYWSCQSVPEDFDKSLDLLIAEFGVSKKIADGNVVVLSLMVEGYRMRRTTSSLLLYTLLPEFVMGQLLPSQ
jgi:hypothetical protein